jgi:hypothetical protein
MTAGYQKVFHDDPRIGFLSQAKSLDAKLPALQTAVTAAQAAGGDVLRAAEKAVAANRTLRFNNMLDAVVAGTFLVLVSLIVLLSVGEWLLLLAHKRLAKLAETDPVWLPEYAVAEGKPLKFFNLLALGFLLAKELTGQAECERVQKQAGVCDCTKPEHVTAQKQIYKQVAEKRFNGINRCC